MRLTASMLIAVSVAGAVCLEARAQQPAPASSAAKPPLYKTAK